jgi:hypothetical protein
MAVAVAVGVEALTGMDYQAALEAELANLAALLVAVALLFLVKEITAAHQPVLRVAAVAALVVSV